MRERSGALVAILVTLLVLFPLGFVFHASPRFPGSLLGSLIGIFAALLMLVPLLYVAAKRIPAVNAWMTPRVSTRTLLSLHIYAGVLAPILGLVHAAHKFESPLGVALTGVMLLIVVTGFTGRYLLGELARAARGRNAELASLKSAYGELPPDEAEPIAPRTWRDRLLGFFFIPDEFEPDKLAGRRAQLAGAIVDVEYAVRAEAAVNDLLRKWRKVHIAVAAILYLFLILHIWAALFYGLRWL